jgi:hypothetical protein
LTFVIIGGNATTTRRTTTSNLPTATAEVQGGGGGGAPRPGASGDINGPNDDYVAGATRLSPLLPTIIGGLGMLAGLAAV